MNKSKQSASTTNPKTQGGRKNSNMTLTMTIFWSMDATYVYDKVTLLCHL